MTLRSRLRRVLRRAVPVLTVPALLAGTMAAAAAPARPAAPRRAAAGSGASPHWLSARQASARARATGHKVVASALTTLASQTVANPDGSFTATETMQPVRAWRNGAWASLDATLKANANGSISPAVTTDRLTLSGGGTGPLAVMTVAGRSMTLRWPGRLPAPRLSGATATYPDVLPGVDLAVTAGAQGGFSEVLIVKNAAAAASPALTSLKLGFSAAPLTVTADSAGDLRVGEGPKAHPLFTAPAPRMWDSAPPPAGMPTTTTPNGATVDAHTGLPAASSPAAPGAAAHTARIPVHVTGGTITLSPPASALTGPGTVYPVYIDPTWHPVNSAMSAWTQVDKGYPTTSYWKESSDLQVGDCAWAGCNNVQVARSFIRLPIPSKLSSRSVIDSAYLYTTDVWAPSCTARSVRLYTTGGINSSTNWNNQPSWSSGYLYKSVAYGYSTSCPYTEPDITWNVTSTIQSDAGNKSTQVWGLRAANETDALGWKQFYNGSHTKNDDNHLVVTYNDPPNSPGSRATNPGGSCQTSASTAPVIGNDDVTFSGYIYDDDGDNNLTTRFLILNSSGTAVYDSQAQNTSVKTGNKATAGLTLTRSVMQGLGAGTYHWYALTTDDNGLVSPTPSTDCYFAYNPQAPAAPAVSPDPISGQIGQAVTASFAPTGSCGGSTNPPCPVSYTYQFGANRPVTVTADSSGNWNGTITIPRVGPVMLTVYATDSGGNVSSDASVSGNGSPPAQAYADSDFNGDGQPDLLTAGSGTKPGLWLSPGTGTGTVGRAADIGGAGTGINPGADGPGDWSGAITLHGNLMGNNVQDVMAYYPTGTHAGAGEIIGGTGDGSMLQPYSGNVAEVNSGVMGNLNGSAPATLIAAGNASEIGTGTDDLIGISGDSTNPDNYELDLYTNGFSAGGAITGGYGWTAVLSTTAPAGSWHDYALATVHLPDTTHPSGNPDNMALFALDTGTGALWESTNPNWNSGDPNTAGCPNDGYDYTQSGCTVIGAPGSTWTPITVPWGSSPPSQITGDVNAAGQAELWATSSGSATAYVLANNSLSQENASATATPSHEWPIAEGSGTTAADTTGATPLPATLTGTATWTEAGGDVFAPTLSFDGSTGALATSGKAIDPASDFSASAWVRPSAAGGTVLSQDMSHTASFKIYSDATTGKWYFCMATSDTTNASYNCASGGEVQLGMWTQLTATYQASPGVMNLYVGGTEVASATHTPLTGTTSGGFQIGDALSSDAHSSYLKGDISDIGTWNKVIGPPADSGPSYYQPITPTRILDTRNGTGGFTGPVGAYETITLKVAGSGGIPAANVTAVAVSITAVEETAAGFVSVYADSTPRPVTSNLNYVASTNIANFAIVPVGPDGRINLYSHSSGTTQLIVDAFGYFTGAVTAGDSTYTPMPTPTRILDTRNGTGAPQAQIPSGGTLKVQIGGANGIPSSVAAVAINLTAISQSTGYLTAYADGTTLPGVANIQFGSTPDISGMAIVPVGTDGKIDVYVHSAAIDLVGDVSGYFTSGTSGYKYHPTGTIRMIDTRQGGQPVAAYGTLTISPGAAITAPSPVMIMNLAVVNGTKSGFLNAYPGGTTAPNASSVNYVSGQVIPNLAITATGTQRTIDVYNHSSGTVDVVADTMGYFSPQ